MGAGSRAGVTASLVALLVCSACATSVGETEENEASRSAGAAQELRKIPVEPQEAVAAISVLVKSSKPHALETLTMLFADEERVKTLFGKTVVPIRRRDEGKSFGYHLLEALKALARGGRHYEKLLVSGFSAPSTFGKLHGGKRRTRRNILRVMAMGYVPQPSEDTYEVLRRLMALPEKGSLPPPPKPFVPQGRWQDLSLLRKERSYVAFRAIDELIHLTSGYGWEAVESLCRIGTERARQLLFSELRRRYERYGNVGYFGWAAAFGILPLAERYRNRPAVFSLLADARREFGKQSPFIIEMILSEKWCFKFPGEAMYISAPRYDSIPPSDAAAYAAGFRSILDSAEGKALSQAQQDRLRTLLDMMVKKERRAS